MNPNQSPNDPFDRLLDQIACELRNHPSGLMPDECRSTPGSTLQSAPGNPESGDHRNDLTSDTRQITSRISTAGFWAAVAAVLLLGVTIGLGYWWKNHSADHRRVVEGMDPTITIPGPSPAPANTANDDRNQSVDDIIEIPFRESTGLMAMEKGIDRIESELDGLRRQAQMLDARRRATELANKLAMLD